jgi:hypothetical protein
MFNMAEVWGYRADRAYTPETNGKVEPIHSNRVAQMGLRQTLHPLRSAKIASVVSEGRDRELRFGDLPPAAGATASSFRASMLTCGGPRLILEQ